jgi:hypothetical protein
MFMMMGAQRVVGTQVPAKRGRGEGLIRDSMSTNGRLPDRSCNSAAMMGTIRQ